MEIGIEVRYVSKNQAQETVYLTETIEVKDVASFRPWKKGEMDMDVKEEMTLLLLYPKPWEKKEGESDKPRKLLLVESYNGFMMRMRANGVLVK